MATINNLQDITDLFMHLDQMWLDAMTALEHVGTSSLIVPTQLTIYCFRELRVSVELLLSCCTIPGFSHLRSAMEAFVQAQKIERACLRQSMEYRDKNRPEYDKHFKANFKANLFPATSGLEELHPIWKMLCDVGPHPNVTSLGVSSTINILESDASWQLDF